MHGLVPPRPEAHLNAIYTNPVRTSQETDYVSTIKANRLMLFGETVAVYFEQNAEFWCVKAGGTYSDR
jgi:hypothetical protein